LEMKFDVPPTIWQKFEQMSGDIGRDRTEVITEIIEKAYTEFKAAEEVPVATSEE